MSGRPFPVSDPRTLDIGAGAFSHAAEVPENDASVLPPLKISDVANSFARIAEASGKGSREQKYSRLRELIEMASAHERPILFRLLHNELRIGLHDGLIQEAIARASGSDLKTVRRAALFLSDLAEVAAIALTDGADGLQRVNIKLFVPLLPMLSELSEDFDEIIKTHSGETALEYKYDGARVQIHKDRDQVRIWSRRLTEVTESLPEIAEIARNHLRGDSFILDAEVVATGSDGRPFPFQELMRRFRRVHGIETAAGEIPLSLYLFDCLYLDGRSLIDEPYEARWRKLGEISCRQIFGGAKNCQRQKRCRSFSESISRRGPRRIDGESPKQSVYARQSRQALVQSEARRNYRLRDPGRRSRFGAKARLALQLSSRCRRSRRRYAPVGKTFKGLTDKQFIEMTARLKALAVAR